MQESILATSVAIIVSGLIGLMPSNNLRVFLAGGSIGGIGTIFASKKFGLQSTEKDIEARVRQLLKTEFDPKLKDRFNDFLNLSQQQLDRELIENSSMQKQIDNLENQLKSIEKLLQSLEPDSIDKKSDLQNQSIQALSLNPSTSERQNSEEILQGNGVVEWLKERGIKVKKNNSNTTSTYNKELDKLAVYLGENYDSLSALHRKLRGGIIHGNGFGFSLRDRNQNDIRINTTFGSMLKETGFLSNYYYDRKSKVMHIGTHKNKDLERYICGSWFERFIFNKFSAFLRSHELKSESLVNAEVLFPNEDRYELDLLFLVKEHLFWIECKAGTGYDRDFPKYSNNHQQFLQLPKTNALVVCLSIDKDIAVNRTALWKNITVTNPESLLTSIESTLNLSLVKTI